MTKKEVTVREYIEAIRKNGWPQIQGQFFETDAEGNIVTACAYTQAMMNLGVMEPKIERGKTFEKDTSWELSGVYSDTISFSDYRGLNLEEIATALEEQYQTHLDETLFSYDV